MLCALRLFFHTSCVQYFFFSLFSRNRHSSLRWFGRSLIVADQLQMACKCHAMDMNNPVLSHALCFEIIFSYFKRSIFFFSLFSRNCHSSLRWFGRSLIVADQLQMACKCHAMDMNNPVLSHALCFEIIFSYFMRSIFFFSLFSRNRHSSLRWFGRSLIVADQLQMACKCHATDMNNPVLSHARFVHRNDSYFMHSTFNFAHE